MGIPEPETDYPHDSEQDHILIPTSSSSSRSLSPTPSQSSSTSTGSLRASELDSPSSSLLIPVHRHSVNGYNTNPRRSDSSTHSTSTSVVQNPNPNPNPKPKKHFRIKANPFIGRNKKTASRRGSPALIINNSISVSNLSEGSVSSGIAGERCSNCASNFAADCTALCCCPLGLLRVLVFIILDLPYSVASKMVSCIKTRAARLRRSRSNASSAASPSIFTPSWSFREPISDKELVDLHQSEIIRFDDELLLNHFQTDGRGFFN